MPKKSDASTGSTTGFGCPEGVGVHHFVIRIPKAVSKPVAVIEEFGFAGPDGDETEAVDRVLIPRRHWTRISSDIARVFNERLRQKGLKTGKWKVGDNRVDRLLGRELTVLAWAIEAVEPEDVIPALRNWLSLRPEERWWLFGMAAADGGHMNDRDHGWRVALRFALAHTITDDTARRRRAQRMTNTSRDVAGDLFTDAAQNGA